MRNDLSIYSTYAPNWWDESKRFFRLLYNLVSARLKYFDTVVVDWSGKIVLDLGCGGGFMSEALARKGATVIGVDPFEDVIRAAQVHAESEALKIDYMVGCGESIPLDDHSVDCVVCVDVLEHVADLDQVIGEIRRVLKPGGIFLFDTINRTFLAALVIIHLAETVFRLLPRGTHDFSKFIRPSDLELKLKERGLVMRGLVGLGPCGINRRLDFTFGHLPFVQIMYMGHALSMSCE